MPASLPDRFDINIFRVWIMFTRRCVRDASVGKAYGHPTSVQRLYRSSPLGSFHFIIINWHGTGAKMARKQGSTSIAVFITVLLCRCLHPMSCLISVSIDLLQSASQTHLLPSAV